MQRRFQFLFHEAGKLVLLDVLCSYVIDKSLDTNCQRFFKQEEIL